MHDRNDAIASPLPFGVRVRDMPDAPATAEAAVASAVQRGCTNVQFPSLEWISPSLEGRRLAEAGSRARDAGLAVSAALGVLNPVFPERSQEIAAFGDGDAEVGAVRLIAAAGAAGIDALHLTVGRLEDRFLDDPPYARQCERTAAMLSRLAPVAEDAGAVLVLKTHEEMSSHEAVSIVEEVGSRAVRIGFSPVNLLVLAEEPLAAAARVRPLVHTLFVDDAALVSHRDGLRRVMLPLGEGDVDWPVIVGLFADGELPQVALDIHRAEFDVPFLREDWLPYNPHVTARELIALLARTRPSSLAQDVSPAERFEKGVAVLAGMSAPSLGEA